MHRNNLLVICLTLALAACSDSDNAGPGLADAGLGSGQDAGAAEGCTSLGKSRGASEACCPDLGADACGANLFCAAFDGRTQATCYIERSRLDQTECAADVHCNSGSCNLERRLCRSTPGMGCDPEIGCAPLPDGSRFACDARDASPTCRIVGDGKPGAVCDGPADCSTGICIDGGCGCPIGRHICNAQCVLDISVATCGGSCEPCPNSVHGTATCDGTRCGFKCDSGARLCGTDCRLCPSGTGVKSTGCSGSACVATACNTGYQLCSGACVACSADPNATTRGCSQGKCISTACKQGYSPRDGVCVANSERVSRSFSDRYPIDLVLDANDQPHVAYSGLVTMMYARRTTSGWQAETVDSNSSYGLFYPTLAFDAAGAAHLAYYSDAGANMRYASRGTTTWTRQTVADFARRPTSRLVIDSAGTPHVAYTDSYAFNLTEDAESIHYATRGTGGTWTKERVEVAGKQLADLRLDANGSPVISFVLRGETFRTARRNGAAWAFESIPAIPPGTRRDFLVDASGTVHVSYIDDRKALSYAVHDGTQWNVQVVDAAPLDTSNTALALDPLGHPVIGYVNTGRHPRLARWNGTQWSLKDVDTGRKTSQLDVEVDARGHAHFVYGDGDKDELHYVVVP